MMPWEREVYLVLLENHLEEQEERMKQQNG